MTDVHWFDRAHSDPVACGVPNVNLVNTTDHDRVTCSLCRNTRAWKDAAA